jgi:DNA topoisomerase IB
MSVNIPPARECAPATRGFGNRHPVGGRCYVPPVPKTIQIRNLDDKTYDVLRQRAAAENLSLNRYLKRVLDELAEPTIEEMLAHGGRQGER